MEDLSRWVMEAGWWVRRCCCGEEEEAEEEKGRRDEEEQEEEEEEEVKMEELNLRKSRSSTSLPPAELDPDRSSSSPSGSQPHWFHTLQVRRFRVRRGRSNSDPLGGNNCEDHFTWKPGLRFGASHSYLSLEKLGEGAYASVYKGISRINGQLVALKVIRTKTEEGVPFTAIREASLLKGLKHANIVVLHDIIHTRDSLTFVFEYVQTDLAQYLTDHPGGLHSHNIRLFMFQLLRALCFIHSRRILHRDLKPHNLLISYLGELKLADFGLARSKSIPSQTFSSEVVTLWYRPPDVLLGSTDYSTALDIWGAGCIFVEMLQGAPAFPGVTDVFEQLQKIWMVLGLPSEESWPGVTQLPNYKPEWFHRSEPKQFRSVWKRLDQLPYKTEDLVQRMLRGVPAARISAQDALRHPYFSTLPAPIMHLRDSKSAVHTVTLTAPLPLTSFFSVFQPCPFSRCQVSDWRRKSETSSTGDRGSNPPCCPPPSSGEKTRTFNRTRRPEG
ncbi:cyclin-dependent kinase 15-like [Plectropomus leopardus]|uniref:cyclin-dependent kinase 15-like n=1 Tax=Plectropomus leopardus TaxID=160734 RepID=UPI001C4BD226|nr:cyclin-dependent kinase 15-like [Plectropomus leopardus]